jgi:hypothetical protein
MEPIQAMQLAIKGEHVTKGVATRLGLHKNTVYKELSDPIHCTYTRFLQRFFAIDAENPTGSASLFEDFRARVIALRRSRDGRQTTGDRQSWTGAVANVVKESSEAISAALTEGDKAKVEREIVQAIDSLRELLQLGVERDLRLARGRESDAGHSEASSRVTGADTRARSFGGER